MRPLFHSGRRGNSPRIAGRYSPIVVARAMTTASTVPHRSERVTSMPAAKAAVVASIRQKQALAPRSSRPERWNSLTKTSSKASKSLREATSMRVARVPAPFPETRP